MSTGYMISVEEIIEELGVSSSYAYKLIREMNKSLAEKGYRVVRGRISRKFFEEQFYGMNAELQKGE